MITRIEIDGFKSFVGFSLDLAPFTAVIGTNAGGKSNLIDAFRFLAASVKGDLYDAIDAVRGDAASLFHQFADGSRVDTMNFAVEFAGTPGSSPMRYETQVGWNETVGLRRLVHKMELVKPISAPADAGQALTRRDGRLVEPVGRRNLCPEAPESEKSSPWIDPLEELAGLRACRFESSALRRLSKTSLRHDLAPDGFGLPGYLLQIRNLTRSEDDPEGALRDIRQVMHGIVPDVTRFGVIEDKIRRDVRIEFTAENEPPFEAEVASDGTLRTLAILAVLADPFQNGPLLIDEPENGVYPERLRNLLRVIGSITEAGAVESPARPTQVLLASRSPVVLDVLDAENVVFLDAVPQVGRGRRRRVTRARRAAESIAEDSTSNWGPSRPDSLARFQSGRGVARLMPIRFLLAILPAGAKIDEIRRAFTAARREPFVAVVPMRETEAWLLADHVALVEAVGSQVLPLLTVEAPRARDVERLADPQKTLNSAIATAAGRRVSGKKLQADRPNLYADIATNLNLDRLRQVPSFQCWWDEMAQALEKMGFH